MLAEGKERKRDTFSFLKSSTLSNWFKALDCSPLHSSSLLRRYGEICERQSHEWFENEKETKPKERINVTMQGMKLSTQGKDRQDSKTGKIKAFYELRVAPHWPVKSSQVSSTFQKTIPLLYLIPVAMWVQSSSGQGPSPQGVQFTRIQQRWQVPPKVTLISWCKSWAHNRTFPRTSMQWETHMFHFPHVTCPQYRLKKNGALHCRRPTWMPSKGSRLFSHTQGKLLFTGKWLFWISPLAAYYNSLLNRAGKKVLRHHDMWL